MEAKVHSTASFTWKSLMGSRFVLEKGMTWRVGNGRSINVWNDQWLPNIYNPGIISPRRNLDASTTVADLMISGSPLWDHQTIDTEFQIDEAALIKTIPISRCGLPDRQVWLHSKNGLFTVKSGYHLVKEVQQGSRASSSYSAAIIPNFNWKRLWSLPIPEHIKAFVWRAIRGILPTAENLVKKKVLVDSVCKICGEASESLDHCFRFCHVARQVWLLSPLGIRSTLTGVLTERDWLVNMVHVLINPRRRCFLFWHGTSGVAATSFCFKG